MLTQDNDATDFPTAPMELMRETVVSLDTGNSGYKTLRKVDLIHVIVHSEEIWLSFLEVDDSVSVLETWGYLDEHEDLIYILKLSVKGSCVTVFVQ